MENIKIDVSLARGLSYYTGAIFEINVHCLAGSLGAAALRRAYRNVRQRTNSACGFSLGLERILVVMEERGMFPEELNDNSADVLIPVWNEKQSAIAQLAGRIAKRKSARSRLSRNRQTRQQFKYAGQINVPFVCVLGETNSRK